MELILAHYEDALLFYGSELGGRVMRKHLGWYLDAAGTTGSARRSILTASDPATVRRLVNDALEPTPRVAA